MAQFDIKPNNTKESADSIRGLEKELSEQIEALDEISSALNNDTSLISVADKLRDKSKTISAYKSKLLLLASSLDTIISAYEKSELNASVNCAKTTAQNVGAGNYEIHIEYIATSWDELTDEEQAALLRSLRLIGNGIKGFLSFFGLYNAIKKKTDGILTRVRDAVRSIEEKERIAKEEAERKAAEEAEAARKAREEEEKRAREEEERKAREEAERRAIEEQEEAARREEAQRQANLKNKVFDSLGKFGARQVLNTNDKSLYEIVRMFYPEYTDQQCAQVIKNLGPEGCGYAGMANAILWAYEGNPEAFEANFGFSMYKNNDLNFDDLTLYIYTMFDDPNEKGTNPSYYLSIVPALMQQGGLDATVHTFYEPSFNDIPNLTQHGVLAFCTQDAFDLKTPAGKWLHFDEAHYMTVTGITSDGMLEVSSWSGKYYIDPNQRGGYYTYYTFSSRP